MTARLFLFKLMLFSLPFLLVVSIYFYMDPFKVFKHYECYYQSGQPGYIIINKDVVSTENWINQNPLHQYNSYIFGNSRSIFYQINSWKKYIRQDASRCYHFDASGESIYGIAKKIAFLDRQHIHLANVLLVIDEELLSQYQNSDGHIFKKDPKVSGQNPLAFQVDCLKDFFDIEFMLAYFDFKLSGTVKEYMKNDCLLDDRPFFYDSATNEVRQDFFESMIRKNPQDYYGPRQALFYKRDTTTTVYSSAMIREPQMVLLDEIADVFRKNSTNYRVVISPLYDQKKMNPTDLKYLQHLFGEENVFDFSGINPLTNNAENYYETSHYRPVVADYVMNVIYGEPVVHQKR